MHIKKYTSSLLELIRYANKDKSLELEARLKSTHKNEINSEVFFNVMKRLKGIPDLNLVSEYTELDIGLTGDYDNMRVSILGDQNINDYCKQNDIKVVRNAAVTFMKKTPIRFTDINEYNLRFNLKREEVLDNTDGDVSDILKGWTNLDKTFRYKKRFTFASVDGMFRFDLTMIKTSQKKMVKGKNKKKKKKDIKPYMTKYVVKPHYATDVKTWLEKQADDSMIEMKGRSYQQMMTFKSMQKSNVLKNDLEYEIEIEYMGNKNAKLLGLNDMKILGLFMQKVMIIMQAVQKSYYIISEIEKMKVIDEYKSLVNDFKFNGPMNVSLTTDEIIEKNYEEYDNSVSIRKGYSVTDKADGERNLLIILKDGDMYLLNRKNDVKKLNAKCVGLASSIYDTEYITKDKNGDNINLLMIFDLYFLKGEDVRNRILNRTEDEKAKNIILQSRYELIIEKMNEFYSNIEKTKGNNLEVLRKKFYFGDDEYVQSTDTELVAENIDTIKNVIHNMDTTSEEYKKNMEQLAVLKADTKIFKEAAKVYSKEYPYHIDGLVFTPRKLAVGEEPGKEKKNQFNGRWYRCYKWKPPEENSIDFLCVFKRQDNSKEYETKYVTVNGRVIECRILVLNVGYNPVQHTKFNSYKVLNENVTFETGYNPTPFVPTQPYIKDIHLCYLPIENGNCYSADKNIINDNSIIEFSYKHGKEAGFCWHPMRIRDTLKPNDFVTANNVWTSIFNPVTLNMITTGNVPYSLSRYFDNNMDRDKKVTKPMNDFHSFIKKKILSENIAGKKTIIDFGVGKAGDMKHWVDVECNLVVGIDSIKDNLDNPQNGACNRILTRYGAINGSNSNGNVKSLLDNTMMVWADCSKNVLNAEAANDDISKLYLQNLYGMIPESSITNSKMKNFHNVGSNFDLAVCNFAIHYFFENKKTLNTFAQNVAGSLRSGGRFVCTTLDGEKIFEKLKNQSSIESRELKKWKITKKYLDDIDSFVASERSLGMTIDVFVSSIGQSIKEYLVHPDYLKTIMADYGLNMIDKVNFYDVYSKEGSSSNYGDMKKLQDDNDLMEYSSLNMFFVFEKE